MNKKKFLRELWVLAGEQRYESVDVREYCAENGIDEQQVGEWIENSYPVLEYGTTPMYPWFIGEPNA